MDKKEKTAKDSGKDTAPPVEFRNIKAQAIVDGSAEQARNLIEGSWVAFISDTGKQWAKLLWKDAVTEAMLFVGKNGVKMFETQAAELAEKLRLGQAVIAKVDEKTITERVLSELMSL